MSEPSAGKRRNWTLGKRQGAAKDSIGAVLSSPAEGQELNEFSVGGPGNDAGAGGTNLKFFPRVNSVDSSTTPSRTSMTMTTTSAPSSRPPSRPTTPRRWTANVLTSSPKPALQELDNEASQLIISALERTNSNTMSKSTSDMSYRTTGSFGKMALNSVMGGLSALSLSRVSSIADDRDKECNKDKDSSGSRGRTMFKSKNSSSSRPPSAGPSADQQDGAGSRSQSRARSTSPFHFRRKRRDASPVPQPLPLPHSHSDADLSDSSQSILPRSTAFDPDSDYETVDGDMTEDDDLSDEELFDPDTERNTAQNALITPVPLAGADADADIDPDPLGEGQNVVVPPEPYFPTTLNSGSSMGQSGSKKTPRKRKSIRHHEPLPMQTSRPIFKRDRCTITITQGDPEGKLGNRRQRRYVIASDLSEESRYALEWGIGTVLRDGDQLLVVNVMENESKVDPETPGAADRAIKLRSQQERQGLAYILVRQVTGLLQRTKLNVSVACQAWHAKNARHMLLDIVDYNEPTMLIVGSRGLGQLKGILLGSTSHYLIQKCSVPVMVARRRLKRPPRRSAHLSTHRTHVSLAEARIDSMAAKVDEDVKVMRDEIQRDDHRREDGPSKGMVTSGEEGMMEEEEEAEEDVGEGSPGGPGDSVDSMQSADGVKVRGD